MLDGARVCGTTATVIGHALEHEFGQEKARDIGFHVADWNSDAAFVVALHLYPERFSPEEIAAGVGMLLIHAPNHLAAAAALGWYAVEDIFGVMESHPGRD